MEKKKSLIDEKEPPTREREMTKKFNWALTKKKMNIFHTIFLFLFSKLNFLSPTTAKTRQWLMTKALSSRWRTLIKLKCDGTDKEANCNHWLPLAYSYAKYLLISEKEKWKIIFLLLLVSISTIFHRTHEFSLKFHRHSPIKTFLAMQFAHFTWISP
jgi:hypothetical protein